MSLSLTAKLSSFWSLSSCLEGGQHCGFCALEALNPHSLTPGLPFLIPQKFHLVPSINAVSGSQELQWMVQPHFLGPSSYPRPLAYPQYSHSVQPPRPGVIRALGPTPGVRRRSCEQVRSRGTHCLGSDAHRSAEVHRISSLPKGEHRLRRGRR